MSRGDGRGYGRSVLPVSVLDLAPIVVGGSPAQALRNSLDLAQHAEELGYNRYWVAEHHNLSGIASAATSVVIGHIGAGDGEIRVGAGGVMLPNHPPLVIAEQFATLEALFPGRVDLGVGRAPGTDQITLRALRQDPTADTFPQDVLELQALLGDPQPGQRVFAIPGVGSHVPLWILGSSLYGAQLAAALGLPYAFASHFAPEALLSALEIYRERFQPSAQLQQPYAMVAVNVVAADDDATAARLFTSVQQSFTNIFRGARATAAAGRRHRGVLVDRGAGTRASDAEPFLRRIRGHRSRGPRRGDRRDRRGRAHRRQCRCTTTRHGFVRTRSSRASGKISGCRSPPETGDPPSRRAGRLTGWPRSRDPEKTVRVARARLAAAPDRRRCSSGSRASSARTRFERSTTRTSTSSGDTCPSEERSAAAG